jgi:hypothetical protein
MQVMTASPQARFFIHLRDLEGNTFVLVEDRPLPAADAGLIQMSAEIPPIERPLPHSKPGAGTYDPQRIVTLIIGIGYGPAAVAWDEFTLLTDPKSLHVKESP